MNRRHSSNFEIYPVTPEDAPAYLQEGVLDLHPAIVEGLGEAMASEDLKFYVALSNTGEAAGQIGLKMSGPTNELVRHTLQLALDEAAPQTGFLKVRPEFRQRGLATELVRRACGEVAVRGYNTIFGKYANAVMERVFTRLGYTFTDIVLPGFDHQREPDGTYGEPTPAEWRVVYKRLSQDDAMYSSDYR